MCSNVQGPGFKFFRISINAWGATPETMVALMEGTHWSRIEYVVNVETGVCDAYVEYDGAQSGWSTTFTEYLENTLKLHSVSLNTFDRGQNLAAASIEFIRDASKESYCLHGWRGKLEPALAKRLSAPTRVAAGAAGGSVAEYMSAEEMAKLQAAVELSKLGTDRVQETASGIREATDGIREATDGISERMARKEDTDALNTQVMGLRTTIDARDKEIKDLIEKNDRQRYMLGDLRGFQTENAQLTAERNGLRAARDTANDALQREREAHARTQAELAEIRTTLERERDAAKDARNAWLDDKRMVMDELRELQLWRAQWEDERKRLTSLAENNTNTIMEIITDAVRGKRPRTPP